MSIAQPLQPESEIIAQPLQHWARVFAEKTEGNQQPLAATFWNDQWCSAMLLSLSGVSGDIDTNKQTP